MLRIRRTVQQQFAATAVTTSIAAEAEKIKQRTQAAAQQARQAPNAMLDLETRARAERAAQEVRAPAQAASNPEEIEIGAQDDGNTDSQSEGADMMIQTKSVPVSVFGLPENGSSGAPDSSSSSGGPSSSSESAAPMSVKERFNKKRQRQEEP